MKSDMLPSSISLTPDHKTLLFPESVAVIGITPDIQLLLVRQYRYTVKEETLELPGGKVGTDETPLLAAYRELEEETGYKATSLRHILTLDMDFSVSRHKTHLFTGYIDCTGIQKDHFIVEKLSLAEALNLVTTGGLTHAPSVAGVLFVSQSCQRREYGF